MKLSLKKIIEVPSGSVPFSFGLDLSDLSFPQIVNMKAPFAARGKVRNAAGALELAGEMDVDMTCICDRCIQPYEVKRTMPVTANLAAELQDEDNPDIFPVSGDEVDLDEVFTTAFVLSMESKFVCSEDCEGICPKCGANLSDGDCHCGDEIDSRLAVLQQLLDGDEEATRE